MNHEQMHRVAWGFPTAIAVMCALMLLMSLGFASHLSIAVGIALLPSLAVMLSSTFFSVIIRGQADRISELENQISERDKEES